MKTDSATALNQRYPDEVPTIQIRDVPEETYETIRLRARAAGQSIQAYMLDQVNAMAASKTKEEVVAAIKAVLERHGTAVTMESIVRDRDADRR
jgi:hypothetical protein